MYKYYSRSTTSMYLIFLTITSLSLFCMENKILIDPPALIKDLIIRNIPLSHDDVCSWALVNQEYNKLIHDTVELRKNYLKNYALTQNKPDISAHITWHKYGSAYTFLTEKAPRKIRPCKKITFNLIYLTNNNTPQQVSKTFHSRLLQCPYNNHYRPCFRSNREVYFHGFRFHVPSGSSTAEGIFNLMEYSLSIENALQVSQCLFDINDSSQKPLNYIMFFEFPALLQAFLQSTHVDIQYKQLFSEPAYVADTIKIHAITGVTIPDNYTLFKECRDFRSPSKSFDDLPHNVKYAITKRYNEQPYYAKATKGGQK